MPKNYGINIFDFEGPTVFDTHGRINCIFVEEVKSLILIYVDPKEVNQKKEIIAFLLLLQRLHVLREELKWIFFPFPPFVPFFQAIIKIIL